MSTSRRMFLSAAASSSVAALTVPSLGQTTTPPTVSDTIEKAFGTAPINLFSALHSGQPGNTEAFLAAQSTQIWFDYLAEIGYNPWLKAFIDQTVVVAPLTPQQLDTMNSSPVTSYAGYTMTKDQASRMLLLAETNFAATQHTYAQYGPKGLSDAVIATLKGAAEIKRLPIAPYRQHQASVITAPNNASLGIAIQYLAFYTLGICGSNTLPGISNLHSPLYQSVDACSLWNYGHVAFTYVMAKLA